MIITNETEYHAWNTEWNGLKRRFESSDLDGYFAVVNLLGPRDSSQTSAVAGWDRFTYVQLRVQFVTDKSSHGGSARAPIVLPRTYMTFYDFDTGQPQFEGSYVQREAMQTDPAIKEVLISSFSELNNYSNLHDFLLATSAGSPTESSTQADLEAFFTAAELEEVESWTGQSTSRLYAASTYGVGKDNPVDTYQLTEQQKARSVMLRIENASEFRVRVIIAPCCTTGRNFMFAGYSNTIREICPFPPPSLPSPPTPPPQPAEPEGLPPYDAAGNCTPVDSFAHIDFTHAELVRSNLGGQGGRCATSTECTETCTSCAGGTCTAAECVGMANEIYIKNVGVNGVCVTVVPARPYAHAHWRSTLLPIPSHMPRRSHAMGA